MFSQTLLVAELDQISSEHVGAGKAAIEFNKDLDRPGDGKLVNFCSTFVTVGSFPKILLIQIHP